jgi:AbrB family looped-hinge helix DNA binding protein
MIHTTKLSTKGQVVLPKSIRAARRWRAGTEFIIEEYNEGILLKPKSEAAMRNWDELIGCVAYHGPRKSLREMNQAIAAQAREMR